MSADHLLAAFVAEYRAGGEADPRAFIDQAAPGERRELSALIDAFLANAPRQPFSGAASTTSSAERTVDALERALVGQSGLWPSLLPRLRTQAGLKRSELVARLAVALGASGGEEKVAGYYHKMEQGLLPSAGVADRVLDALGQILGETTKALRQAGRTLAAPGSGARQTASAFARTGRATEESGTGPAPASTADWDEVDRLFLGG